MSKLIEGSPARYRLAVEPGTIQIAVNKSVLPTAKSFSTEQVEITRRELDLPDTFTAPNPDREWGFGPILKDTGVQNPEWVIFQADFPQMEDAYDPKGFAVAATLGLVFAALDNTETESSSKTPQGLKIILANSRRRFSSNDIFATLFKPIINFLDISRDGNFEKAVSEAMLATYTSLRGEDKSGYLRELIALRRPSDEIMYFRAPGDATELQYSKQERILRTDPDTTLPPRERIIKETQYRLTPKNLDRVDSQLTLLAGVAKLDELAMTSYLELSQE